MRRYLDIATLVAKELETTELNDFGISSSHIDTVLFTVLYDGKNFDINASIYINNLSVTIASATNPIFLHAVATCVMNLVGFKGDWTFNKIQQAVEEEERKALEHSLFCESLGYDN